MYYKDNQNFRNYAYHVAFNNIKVNFTRSAQKLVSGLSKNNLVDSEKYEIHPQLF